MSDASIVARARCSALLTDATLVPSSSATSLACHRRTSRRMRTARCFGGRSCSAATNASLIVSFAAASSAGSPSVGMTRESWIGRTQVCSTSGGPSVVAAVDEGPRSIGRARRCEPLSMSRQTLWAMR